MSSRLPGYIGKSSVPVSTLLGSLLINAESSHIPYKDYSHLEKRDPYRHRYPRTTKTHLRTSKAVEIMRYTYRFSMNNIGLGLQISTRTVYKHIKILKKLGFKAFHCMKNRLYRSKNSATMQTLRKISARIQSYIDGQISLLQLYTKLGIDPP